MAGKVITSKFDANCYGCGNRLPAGSKVKWYGRGIVYGLKGECDCNASPFYREVARENESAGLLLSRADRYGVYTVDGQKIGSTCGCEDYPCCGH